VRHTQAGGGAGRRRGHRSAVTVTVALADADLVTVTVAVAVVVAVAVAAGLLAGAMPTAALAGGGKEAKPLKCDPTVEVCKDGRKNG
jgi:hypothetical protein